VTAGAGDSSALAGFFGGPMGTFAQMETRIIAELHRDDVATQVDDYINDAINHYSRYRFWFNEKSATIQTMTDSGVTYDIYDWPTDFVKLDSMVLTINNAVTPLAQVSPRELDELYIRSTDRGQPTLFATYAKQFRLYPTPDKVWPLTLYYLFNIPPDSTGGQGDNMWTENAEELIRTRAKKLLVGQFNPTPDTMQWVQMLDMQERDLLRGLQQQTVASTATGRLRNWDA
jgi:hypothetical protein